MHRYIQRHYAGIVPHFLAHLLIVAAAIFSGTSAAAPITALTFPAQRGTTASFVNGVDGWEFIPSTDIRVTSLGYYDDGTNGLLSPHTVGIFNTVTHALVTPTVTVNSSTTLDGLFRFAPISAVVLNAGQSYTIAGSSAAPFDPLVNNPSGQVFAPEVLFGQYRVQLFSDFQFPSLLQPGHFFAAPNFQFETAPLLPPAQTIFLEFSNVDTPVPAPYKSWWARLTDPATYSKPDAAFVPDQITRIVEEVGKIFSDFKVLVTNDKTKLPSSSDYSTIYVGGSKHDLPLPYHLRTRTELGIADGLDFFNSDKDDFALVYSEDVRKLVEITPENLIPTLSALIAHEAGHILGLAHVVEVPELMFPSTNPLEPNVLLTDKDVDLVEIKACQNSYQQLATNVGLNSGTPKADFCHVPFRPRLFMSLSALSGTIFGARLAIVTDNDAGPTFFELGDLTEGTNLIHSLFPVADGSRISLFGSSVSGGPLDIISSPLSVDALNSFGFLENLQAENILTPIRNISDSFQISLFRALDSRGFTSFGLSSLDFRSASAVPEPPTLSLLMIALAIASVVRQLGKSFWIRRTTGTSCARACTLSPRCPRKSGTGSL